jgi:glycosyltransferase involved in cell wall biosynthesis
MDKSTRFFIEWLFSDNAASTALDFEALAKWLAPNFQNYTDGEFYLLNPNGRSLLELNAALIEPGVMDSAMQCPSVQKILLVTQYAPSFSHAGGLRVRDIYAQIRAMRPDIRIDLYSETNPAIDGDLSGLDAIFDNVYFEKPGAMTLAAFQLKTGLSEHYDLVDLQFHSAGRLAKAFRAVGSHLLFTPMECLSRSYFDIIGTKLDKENRIDIKDIFGLIHFAIDELRIMKSVDQTVTVSDADASFLKRISAKSAVTHISTGLSKYEFTKELEGNFVPKDVSAKRKKLVFSAYFGSDTNVVGLRWYLAEIHPLVMQVCPDYELMVVGRGDLAWLISQDMPGVTVVGEVPFLSPILEQARGGLVLALHGSGFRGKINQYSICGVPTVSTNLGVTGLDYTDGDNILLADGPAEFAQACINLLCDEALNRRIAINARNIALEKYRWESFSTEITTVYGL